jgi:RNA polymerase sigma factor (sigma-70 family)
LKSANDFVESLEFADSTQPPEEFVSRAVSGAMFAADFGELTENVAAEGLDENDTNPLRVSAEHSLGRSQLRALMLKSLEDLPDDEAALLRGHYLDGISLRELADRKGISRSWASRVHTRALRNAQAVLKKRYKISAADLFDAPRR